MNSRDIREKKFEKSFNGYKPDEVESFLNEIASEFSELAKENSTLEQKMEVLADKIREYRKDEDALKEAILSAQKQGNTIINEAKEKAKKIVDEAVEEKENILFDIEENKKKIIAECDELKANAKQEAEEIVNKATNRAKVVEDDSNQKIALQKDILARTKEEATDYTSRILNALKKLEEEIKDIPKKCENEFVTNTLKEHTYNKARTEVRENVPRAPQPQRVVAAEPKVEKPVEKAVEPPKAAEDKTQVMPTNLGEKEETPVSNDTIVMNKPPVTTNTADMEFSPIFFEEDSFEDVEDYRKERKPRRDTPFSKKNNDRSKNDRRDEPRLQFGKNNK